MTLLEFVKWCEQHNVDDKATIYMQSNSRSGLIPLRPDIIIIDDDGDIVVRP